MVINMKIRFLNGFLAAMFVASCLSVPAFAADFEVLSQDAETGVTVYRDSGGGIVFSGLPAKYVASKAEQ